MKIQVSNNLRALPNVDYLEDKSLQIIKWGGFQNAFPSTLKNLINQSSSAYPIVSMASDFYSGIITDDSVKKHKVHPTGITIQQLVDSCAINLAQFNAFSIHVNYNLEGKVTSMYPLDIDTIRLGQPDEYNFSNKFGFYWDFGRNDELKKQVQQTPTIQDIKFIDRFDPSLVLEQLEGKTINEYNGQLYWATLDGSINTYPKPPLQSQMDYLMNDVETGTLSRRNVSTGFMDTYLFRTTQTDEKILDQMQEDLVSLMGAENTGGVYILSGIHPDDINNNQLEPLGDSSTTKAKTEVVNEQKETNKEAFADAYKMPPLIAGLKRSTGFSTDILRDSYAIYADRTQKGRMMIQDAINEIMLNAVDDLKIDPIELDGLKFAEIAQNDQND